MQLSTHLNCWKPFWKLSVLSTASSYKQSYQTKSTAN